MQESTATKPTGGTSTGAVEVMTEATKVCETQVQALSRKKTEGLSETGRLQLAGECAKAVEEVTGLLKKGASLDVAASMLSNLSVVLAALPLPESTLEKQVDEALEDAAAGKDKRGEAFNRVIESLQERVAAAVGSAETLRVKLTKVEEFEAESARKLAEAEERASKAEAKLAIATSVLAGLSSRKVPNEMAEAVEEMIALHPELDCRKVDLLEAETPAHMAMLATDYLTTARMAVAPAPTSTLAPRRRSTLPSGVVVESEGIVAGPIRPIVTDAGANIAAAAVAHMSGKPRHD